MIHFTFIEQYAPVFVFLVAFVLVYIGLKKAEIPGAEIVLAVLSFLVALMFISSKNVVRYVFDLMPLITIVFVFSFFTMIILTFFTTKDFNFNKILAWTGLILVIIIAIVLIFDNFPVANHMLPDSSDRGLTPAMEDFKDFLYKDQTKGSIVFVISTLVVGFLMLHKFKE